MCFFNFKTQWKRNEGKCGICGDAYDAQVKPHEAGGRYATRFITETYTQGQQIDVMVELTAPHRGKFFFKICKQTDESKEVTQECLDKTPLKVRCILPLSRYLTIMPNFHMN